MNVESLLQRLRVCLTPKRGAKSRVKNQVFWHIDAPSSVLEIQGAFAPAKGAKSRIWDQIERSITPSSETILDKVRDMLTPPADFQVRIKHCVSFIPQTHVAQSRLKWVASLAVVALLLNLSPALFLTSKTVADAKVTLVPTQGELAVSVGGMWQDVTDEVVLETATRVRTYDEGQASILYWDDAVIRLNESTKIAFHDIVDNEKTNEISSTISLIEGDIWVQGLVPKTIRGMTVTVPDGFVTVNQGSVSIDEGGDTVTVKVWDGKAFISYGKEAQILMVGEYVTLQNGGPIFVKKIPSSQFESGWPQQNLEKDAVHRRYIAHLQQERRAAAAGILPTSNLYPVKRVAEEVDVLLSLSDESRLQKRLDQANSRLNEAAALIAEGEEEEADETLEDYHDAVLEITSGTGGDMEAAALIKESMEETMSEVAASQPGDESYAIKKAVLVATAEMPVDVADPAEAESELFNDSISALTEALDAGDIVAMQELWVEMQEYLGFMEQENSPLNNEARKEARLLLARVATVVNEMDNTDEINPELLDDILSYLPPQPKVIPPMSEEEVTAVVQAMLERVYAFKMHQSRENQLRVELTAISGHTEEGRFLRALYNTLPDGSKMHDMVRREITSLRWQRAGEAV